MRAGVSVSNLVWHEIVNDVVAGQPIAVTYCPLCATAMLFARSLGDETMRFGVSGLLHKSDILVFDRESESLWSQLKMEAATGEHAGKKLKLLASQQLTFKAWRTQHPKGQVLSTKTGHKRNYGKNPYKGYDPSRGLMFPVGDVNSALPRNEWVIGFFVDDQAFAVPEKLLPEEKRVTLKHGQQTLGIERNTSQRSVIVEADEVSIPHIRAYWFAWQAFYPETQVWRPDMK
ncbi:MAG: hypothetical protein CMO80_15180 [Verrucomicrobiales bacterium]|nr:hypothetical protein [Verrucomicrobiales bacterium]